MNYISTRGVPSAAPRSFSRILLEGLAPDGGLYVPVTYPKVTRDELERWRTLSYADLAAQILAKYCDDIPAEALHTLTQAAYTDILSCAQSAHCNADHAADAIGH